METIKLFALFVIAVVAEIVGCYLPYLYLKQMAQLAYCYPPHLV
jgi:drug/metabolite transporter superfamily protein YnfA